jgi:glycosyltransferase involved in cell wall biosynthesis
MLSVAILTHNEEENIRDCLESVKWVDEIVLVDEKSTDRTVAIAAEYTKNIFMVDHEAMFHKNKQIALKKCTGDWIFQIDADERVTPELKNEILTLGEGTFSGYWVPRKSKIFGKFLEHTGWYPDYQVKLFRNGKGKYPCKSVHEMIEIEGEIGTLKSDLLHEHYKSVEQFIDRMNRYTTNDAAFINKPVVWSDAVRYPLDEFLKRFFYWEGYKDGMHGLTLSFLMALYRLVVFAKLWEKQKFKSEYFSLQDIYGEFKKAAKDFKYWQIQVEKNPIKKVLGKIL